MNIIYIRTSTEDQEPENQIKDCEKLSNGEYRLFQDKQSAFKDNKERASFEEARKLIKLGQVEHFIAWDLDRIYRNRIKLKEFFQFCKIYHCKIHSFNQQWLEELNQIPEPFNEIMHDLMLNLMGWLGEDESQKKSNRVKLAVRKEEGKITKSYKGNKWGRKSISTQAINKVLNLKKENPEITMRQIAAQVTYAGKNNNTKNISLALVHKILNESKTNLEETNLVEDAIINYPINEQKDI